MTIRLALITDIHHGRDQMSKRGSLALDLVGEFVRFVGDAKPDLVLDLGDRITDSDHDTDLGLEADVAAALEPVGAPIHHICGNHDRDFLSVEDNERILGQPLGSQTIDIGDWRLVLWRADTLIRRPGGFVLTEQDFHWLAGVLRQADRPLLIASHVPVSGAAMTGSYYFQNNPDSATYPGADRLREQLAQCRQPIAWISGHVHWNSVTLVNGIAHITQQSLTETWTTHPEPAATFGMIELGETVSWQAVGNDSMRADFSTAGLARRWMTPLPTFSDHPSTKDQRLESPGP